MELLHHVNSSWPDFGLFVHEVRVGSVRGGTWKGGGDALEGGGISSVAHSHSLREELIPMDIDVFCSCDAK